MWARGDYAIAEVGHMSATVRLAYHPGHLRPGGTISGPAMFTLADLALYVAILHEIGKVKLAVTTNVSINFLRKPEPRDLIGRAKLMKLGKRLAVGEVALFSEGSDEMVAHATGRIRSRPRATEAAVSDRVRRPFRRRSASFDMRSAPVRHAFSARKRALFHPCFEPFQRLAAEFRKKTKVCEISRARASTSARDGGLAEGRQGSWGGSTGVEFSAWEA